MKCRECRFIKEEPPRNSEGFPSVRCTLGLWDKDNKEGAPQWYSYGSMIRNRGPIKRHGESCTQGNVKEIR